MIDALLIYPKLGSMDSFIVDLPLSLIYAATESVKRGYDVRIVDLRVETGDWKNCLKGYLDEGATLAGISVMTGLPLKYARDISLFIKANYPETSIVWGGPHPTVLPCTITEPYIDYLIRGQGSAPLADLIAYLKNGKGDVDAINGLSRKANCGPVHNRDSNSFENIHYKDIPYELAGIRSGKYRRMYNKKLMFPIFASLGCPYRCSFCVSPAIYKRINGPKWMALEIEDVLGHIEYAISNYGAEHIVFLDDTSFPSIDRMRVLFREIIDRKIKITMEFRGARVNEIDKMDDQFLCLMREAGVRVLMVGVESGSNRILKRMQKGITRERVIKINRKLARYPEIIAHYNFMYGSPGETYEDLLDTKALALQLLEENPSAYFGVGGDWKPIPETSMLEMAEQAYGYSPPKSIDEWIQVDSFDAEKTTYPWYTRRHNDLIKLLQVSSVVIDDKIIKETINDKSVFAVCCRTLSRLYKPVAMYRLRHDLASFMIEFGIWRFVLRHLPLLKAVFG